MTEGPEMPGGLNEALGIGGFERPAPDLARAEMPVHAAVLQPYGIVHGGAFAALAETVTSRATYESVAPELGAFGQGNETSFLRPISAGVVRAEARARHRGRTTRVWDVEMRDDENRLCALSRVTIAVRPLARRADAGDG
jgi:1,4-dihydroxy-2-naphthoyl-CoA hydrolase